MRNLSIWLVDSFLIWPMKSAYSYFNGFDWVLISCVVWIIQIVRIYTLRAVDPYNESVFFAILTISVAFWPHCDGKKVLKSLKFSLKFSRRNLSTFFKISCNTTICFQKVLKLHQNLWIKSLIISRTSILIQNTAKIIMWPYNWVMTHNLWVIHNLWHLP
jgi:hypothetical protein